MDINWALFSNWRDMLVQMFDTPEKLSVLQNCKTLNISYNDTMTETMRHPEIRAIYLQGWLASRLGWHYKASVMHEGNLVLTYDLPEHTATVTLSPHAHPDLPPGAITTMEITSVNNCSFYIARKQSLSQAVIHASSLEKCEVAYSLPLPDIHRGLLFMKEIFYHKISSHYREMLKIISEINYTKL